MIVLYIVLGAIAYLFIGGIVIGWHDEAETHGIIMSTMEAMLYLFFWPFYFLYLGFVFFMQLPARLGRWLYMKFRKE